MSSSPTTRNGFEKQGAGENEHTWGDLLNAALDRIDEAADAFTSFTLSGDKTLTATNYSANESRNRVIRITGGTGGTVTVPAREKNWIVINNATGDVIFTTGAGASVTVTPGVMTSVACDGTDCYLDNGASVAAATEAAAQAVAAAQAAQEAAATIDTENLVHITGAETISGLKTFSAGIRINGQTLSALTDTGKAVAEGTPTTARAALGVTLASNSDVRSGEGGNVVTAGNIDGACDIVTLTDQSTIAINWNAFISAQVSIGGDRTLGNPTNVAPGTTRYVLVKGASGTRSLSFASNYKGAIPSLGDISTTRWYLVGLFAVTTSHIVVSVVRAL